ncbi:CAP domain-containing protein [Actinoplanes sp. NPDC051470]|uniref:CAP domain-containing protein n=1 Tax=Actinoplanes sp. NPDC051470 TaxID=3157224 RepID=UPI003430E2AB
MRKPLVVVCVTASVVLLAGAVAATTAGADTTPDGPAVDFGGLPGVPDLPSGMNGSAPDVPGVPRPDLPGAADARPPAVVAPQGDQGKPAAGTAAAAAAAAANPQRPGGQAPAAAGAAQPVAPQQQDDTPRAGAAAAAAPAAAAKPAAKPAAQPADTVDAARRDVTPGSVSGSPAAPVQQQVLNLVNENRRRGGCESLTLDRRLITAANRHASDMARRGYFAHESPSGDGAGERVEDAGYDWKRYGENIARGADSAYEVVDGWMNSPSHRENIMDCKLHQMGIGLAFDSDRTPYWVQDFATPQ